MDEYKRRRRRSRAVMSMFLDSLGGSIDNVDVAEFDSDGSDLKALIVGIDPVQDLHGYEYPWPAGGGKNKAGLNPSYSDTKNGVTVEVLSNEEIWVHGTPDISSGYISFSPIGVVDVSITDETICFSVNEKTIGVGFLAGSSNGNLNITLSDTVNYRTGVYTAGSYTIGINVRFDVGTIDKKYKLQLEVGSTPTAWAPYANNCPITGHSSVNVIVSPTLNPLDGTITNIPLGTTVYGGTLDVVTGVLTVTHKYKKPPKADIRRNQDTQFYVVVDSEIAMGTEVPCISNKFRPWDGTESLYKKEYYCFVNSGGAIRFNTTAEYSTVDDMYNAIGEMEFICQLATPQTIQLTGQQIATFLGTNHVWCDSGKIIHLEY